MIDTQYVHRERCIFDLFVIVRVYVRMRDWSLKLISRFGGRGVHSMVDLRSKRDVIKTFSLR
jgi:hypothetical protein